MSSHGWRNLCFVLGVVCLVQLWRGGDTAPSVASQHDCGAPAAPHDERAALVHPRLEPAGAAAPARASSDDAPALGAYGFTVPSWAVWLAPHPGEDLRAYRDRMLPLAQAVIAPQRARVARSRDRFAALANLDAHQRAELDGAAEDTAAALQDRVMTAILGGELSPATFKPMIGVGVARDLLDIVGRGNRRFLAALRDDQRTQLAQHPFDFGDYLVFSTPWEDALKLLD